MNDYNWENQVPVQEIVLQLEGAFKTRCGTCQYLKTINNYLKYDSNYRDRYYCSLFYTTMASPNKNAQEFKTPKRCAACRQSDK